MGGGRGRRLLAARYVCTRHRGQEERTSQERTSQAPTCTCSSGIWSWPPMSIARYRYVGPLLLHRELLHSRTAIRAPMSIQGQD